MCGIAGVLGSAQADTLLDHLLNAQIHRGPDSEGRYRERDVALGMRRLSIVDLKGGDQPKCSSDQNIVVFFNGEIYNHQEIRKNFSEFSYQSSSDTEVIPHLWKKEGIDSLQRFNGMFALAVWEKKERKLTLVRDRLGIKPLWLYEKDGVVAFSSEMRAFAETGLSLSLNPQALWEYLTLSYIPSPKSPFKEVKLLPPGHLITFQEIEGVWKSQQKKWWSLPEPCADPHPGEAVEIVREKLERSIERRLMSDVPLGCLLSGGLDSAVLTSWATKLKGEPLHTFSVGYDVGSFDERQPAERLARHLGCLHHSVSLKPEEFLTTLDRAVKRSDTLLADQAIVALVPLYDKVKEEVTVVLDGDGADELFAGYPTITADKYFAYFSKFPRSFRKVLSKFSNCLPESKNKGALTFKFERFLRHSFLTPHQAHSLWRNIHTLQTKEFLVQKEWHPERFEDQLGIRSYLSAMEPRTGDHEFDFSRGDVSVWLPDDNLKKVDGQSMGVSVEARVPFLDHELVETVLPWSVALKRRQGVKGLVREACRGILPDFSRLQPKAGFHLPLAHWFQGILAGEVKERLNRLETLLGSYFEANSLKTYIEKGSADAYSVFNLLVLESWIRQWPQTISSI